MATANFVVAADLDIKLYWHDTTEAVLTFRNRATLAPISFAGHVIRMQVRPNVGSPQVTEEYSTTNGRIVVSGAGSNTLTISSLYLLGVGTFKYDLQSTITTNVLTWLKGSISVENDVTQ
jgi:hypothetical protein